MSAFFDIWDENNPLIKTEYEKDNYLIRIHDNSSPYMVVYFASNGLYYPDTEECFRKTIVENGGRFEWLHYHRKDVKKELFVRDIFKTHYVRGINSRISTMDALIDFIRKEAAGYRLITVGNSAGGYAAAVVGTVLKADMVFNFSGQNQLNGYLMNPSSPICKLKDTSASQYYDLRELWKKNPIPCMFYFYSANNEADFSSWNEISTYSTYERIFPFAFNTNTHEKTMYNITLPTVLDLQKEDLKRLSLRYTGIKIARFEFSVRVMGIKETFSGLIRKTCTHFVRRFKRDL